MENKTLNHKLERAEGSIAVGVYFQIYPINDEQRDTQNKDKLLQLGWKRSLKVQEMGGIKETKLKRPVQFRSDESRLQI